MCIEECEQHNEDRASHVLSDGCSDNKRRLMIQYISRALHDRGASAGDEEIKGAVLGRLPYYLVW